MLSQHTVPLQHQLETYKMSILTKLQSLREEECSLKTRAAEVTALWERIRQCYAANKIETVILTANSNSQAQVLFPAGMSRNDIMIVDYIGRL